MLPKIVLAKMSKTSKMGGKRSRAMMIPEKNIESVDKQSITYHLLINL